MDTEKKVIKKKKWSHSGSHLYSAMQRCPKKSCSASSQSRSLNPFKVTQDQNIAPLFWKVTVFLCFRAVNCHKLRVCVIYHTIPLNLPTIVKFSLSVNAVISNFPNSDCVLFLIFSFFNTVICILFHTYTCIILHYYEHSYEHGVLCGHFYSIAHMKFTKTFFVSLNCSFHLRDFDLYRTTVIISLHILCNLSKWQQHVTS